MKKLDPITREQVIAIIEKLEKLVGGHFPWCPAVGGPESFCSCGMAELNRTKERLKGEP